ncbi:phosphoenolpyruvate--protein phosphotransferase [Deltaproteobacteria bacterium Smac51]|nr:phosphoenolpyruvate--protein phosphotransferase [Deltaproteobacteria bacterium Smac51]
MNLPPPFVPEDAIMTGVGASSGIAIGPARVHSHRDLNVPNYRLRPEGVEDEIARLNRAKEAVREKLIASRDALPPELQSQVGILDAHLMLLDDPVISKKNVASITRDKLNAEQAILATVREVMTALEKVEDPYIRSRMSDVEMVGYSILGVLTGEKASDMPDAPEGSILIMEDISPAEMTRLITAGIGGLATERGSHTSHTAIVAQAIELPAVLGVGGGVLTRGVNNGDIVIIDGRTGHVIVRPDVDTINFYRSRQKMEQSFKAEIVRSSHMPALTLDDRRISIMGNMELMEELPAILSYGGEGIGLYRTEFMYLNREVFPTEDELFSAYKKVVESAAPNPVVIRTLDLGGDKMPAPREKNGRRYRRGLQVAMISEGNEALGLRGIRYCLRHRKVFKSQLKAILRASAFGDVRVMLPMVSSLDELRMAKILLSEAKKSLAAEGVKYADTVPLGIMIEVPATVFVARELAREADFFSIGTNDLIQYTLAVDRGNPEVSEMYQPLHPAILRMLKTILTIGREENVPVSVCGDMAAGYVTAPILVGLGADILSMPSSAIPRIKRIIRMSSSEELSRWANEAMGAVSATQATNTATRYVRAKFPELFQ